MKSTLLLEGGSVTKFLSAFILEVDKTTGIVVVGEGHAKNTSAFWYS